MNTTPLTSAHRCLMAKIQDACVDISLQHPELVAHCEYMGHTHELVVSLVPRSRLGEDRGGDGSYRARRAVHVYLPGGRPRLSDERALAELADTLDHLEGLLPGGEA
ncbi:hypothetical protein LG302_00865 [Halomonas organivorans]